MRDLGAVHPWGSSWGWMEECARAGALRSLCASVRTKPLWDMGAVDGVKPRAHTAGGRLVLFSAQPDSSAVSMGKSGLPVHRCCG